MIIIKALILAHVFVFVCCTYETQKERIKEAMLNESLSATCNDLDSPTQTECYPIVLELLLEEVTAETVKPFAKFISKQEDGFLYSGYIQIYRQIKRQELGDAALFQLAFQVKKDELRTNLSELISLFPGAVLVITSGLPVYMWNRGFEEYLVAAQDEYKYDDERRNVYTIGQSALIGQQGEWTFEHLEGNKFHIKSIMYDEYLISPADSFKYNPDLRRIFTWVPKENVTIEGEWAIEVKGVDVIIRSALRNENLFAVDDMFPMDNVRSVATWVSKSQDHCEGGENNQCQWKLSNS